MVPALEEAISITEQADYVAVIGTSLQVYPAASLMHYAKPNVSVFYIDPRPASITNLQNPFEVIPMNATEGVPILREKLLRS
jgi:NAD-dependent deacetylase